MPLRRDITQRVAAFAIVVGAMVLMWWSKFQGSMLQKLQRVGRVQIGPTRSVTSLPS
jgi:hypothetical protein